MSTRYYFTASKCVSKGCLAEGCTPECYCDSNPMVVSDIGEFYNYHDIHDGLLDCIDYYEDEYQTVFYLSIDELKNMANYMQSLMGEDDPVHKHISGIINKAIVARQSGYDIEYCVSR